MKRSSHAFIHAKTIFCEDYMLGFNDFLTSFLRTRNFMKSYRFLKHILLCTAFFACLGLGLYLFFEEDVDDFKAPASLSSEALSPAPVMHTTITPHFRGMDQKQQPYRITATSSTTDEQSSVTHLTTPTYTLDMHDGKTIHVTSDKGVFDQEKKELILTDNVIVTHEETSKDNKTTMTMPFVRIDLDSGFATGDQSMHLSNAQMMAQAGTFEIYEKGDKIILTKNPILRFAVKSSHDTQHPRA